MTTKKQSISELVADEYPIAVIARRVGISRQDIYNFLNPSRYPYRLSDEKLERIAVFEGRPVTKVRAEYESKAAA
jgi:predicted DNA-binding protein YlxM (UPF0122 family)